MVSQKNGEKKCKKNTLIKIIFFILCMHPHLKN